MTDIATAALEAYRKQAEKERKEQVCKNHAKFRNKYRGIFGMEFEPEIIEEPRVYLRNHVIASIRVKFSKNECKEYFLTDKTTQKGFELWEQNPAHVPPEYLIKIKCICVASLIGLGKAINEFEQEYGFKVNEPFKISKTISRKNYAQNLRPETSVSSV